VPARSLPPHVPPRALTIRQAAEYWGISPNTFRKLVRQGIAPGPIKLPGLGRLLFDREQQDRAIDALSSRAELV
jgi:excisionase family DNA binding protein